MAYVSVYYYLFVIILLIFYYTLPLRYRWSVLLAGSLGFYYWLSRDSWWLLGLTLFISYVAGILIERSCKNVSKRVGGGRNPLYFLILSILFMIFPLIMIRQSIFKWESSSLIAPLGLSFYTLQIISYLVDIYKGKIQAQKNPAKYALYVSFFPQIIQGPIPRYEQLSTQLYEGHRFDEREFTKGLQMIVWGFFLKMMIADKAGIVVDTVFDNSQTYQGGYVLVAGILYSIQLYADFLACVCLSQGCAELFGIHLADNFRHPYFAESIKDFWGRWHISLSSWLRDYIYIPLGGSRKGKIRKYINLIITFLVSGLWHGNGKKYIFWGLMHAGYEIGEDMTANIQNCVYKWLHLSDSWVQKFIRRFITFICVMLAWVIFRARNLRTGLFMLYNMVTVHNPWIFWDDSLFRLGLSWKEWAILIGSVFILIKVSLMQESFCIRDRILAWPLPVRWVLYLGAITVIMVFGTYGWGYDANDFIYGGF